MLADFFLLDEARMAADFRENPRPVDPRRSALIGGSSRPEKICVDPRLVKTREDPR